MPLAIYTSAAWTANGGLEPASQALVTVRNEATGALASVFSDRAGNNGLGNPFNADDQGRFSFYASGGAYRIEVESDGLTQELRYQAVGTSAEYDAGTESDHEAPTDVEKVARLDRLVDGGQINTGQTESVTLSTETLTIPVGMSTIKLPTSVWDGSSNITISAIAFEDGVQPAVGYEFSVVVPKTTDAGSLTGGALGNEVLIQDGASIAVEANNNSDLPCYPNAADNPGADPVQFAAPYYRLDFRVDSYDGSGNPVVSLVRLPDAVSGSNDGGYWERSANGTQICRHKVNGIDSTTQIEGEVYRSGSGESVTWEYPCSFSGGTPSASGSSDTQTVLAVSGANTTNTSFEVSITTNGSRTDRSADLMALGSYF